MKPHPHSTSGSQHEHGQVGPSGQGSVMIDIGPGRGALVLITDRDMEGAEIEIAPAHDPMARTHMAVRRRLGPAGTHYAAIYPSLAPGEYHLYGPDTPPRPVAIEDGAITELRW
jgi:hypothetical protein